MTEQVLVVVGSVLIGAATGRGIRNRTWSLIAAVSGSLLWACVVMVAGSR